VTTWAAERAKRRALADKAHARQFLHNVSDAASYVGLNAGVQPGQAAVVVLHSEDEHATVGAVHVAIKRDGTIVVAVEAEPGVEIEQRRTIRRPRWRFYDFWRWDADRHDNEIRPESEWPVIEEVPS
jgi:hypothetical protein